MSDSKHLYIHVAKERKGEPFHVEDFEFNEFHLGNKCKHLQIEIDKLVAKGKHPIEIMVELAPKYDTMTLRLYNDHIFETGSCIFYDKNAWWFWHSIDKTVTAWDWEKDVKEIIESFTGDGDDVKSEQWNTQFVLRNDNDINIELLEAIIEEDKNAISS